MISAKTRRKELGISQQELSDKAKVSQPAISQYENGKRKPDLETARKIAKVLRVSLDDIFFGCNISK